MPETSRTAASAITYRKVAFTSAFFGTAVAIVICVFIGMSRTEFQSQAVLSYTANAASGSGVPPSSAQVMAARAMDDDHLNTILEGFGLYPEMRQGSLQTATLTRFRSNISMSQSHASQKGNVEVHLVFRDPDPLKSPGVANALADVLANYVPSSGSANATDSASKNGPLGALPNVTDSDNASAGSILRSAAPKVGKGSFRGLSKDQLRKKMDWADGQLADLATEQSTLHAASNTVQARIRRVQLTGRNETSAPHETPRTVVDPNAATRAQLSQQLAAEQQELVALRERYTDAYPDVQTAEANVASLQTRLADLPPPPRQTAATKRAPDLYQGNIDDMTAEESRLGEKLRDVEHQMAGLEHYRDRVRVAMQDAPGTADALSQPTSQPGVKSASPAMPIQSPVSDRSSQRDNSPSQAPALDFDAIGAGPFRVISSASNSIPMQRLSPAILASVAGGWALFMLLCFVPLRWMQSSIIRSESDVRATLPREVAYLGTIHRIVQ